MKGVRFPMKTLKEQIAKENDSRWIGKAGYSCLTCSHSMSTDENELICVVNSIHKKVDEEELCKQWI